MSAQGKKKRSEPRRPAADRDREHADAPEEARSAGEIESASEPPVKARGADSRSAQAPTLWQRAIYRWTAITCVMATLLIIYTWHPYYRNQMFSAWRPVFTAAFAVWLMFGILYVRLTLERFSGMRYMMRDGGLHIILLMRAWQSKRFWRRVKNRRLRTTVLGIAVKAFFTPLMTSFFAGHTSTLCDLWLKHKHAAPLRFNIPHDGGVFVQVLAWFGQLSARVPDLMPHASDFTGIFQSWSRGDVWFTLDVLYNLIFFVDCGWALMGYGGESRWLGNKTRSVEPTGFGWVVCIFCYPPFNNILGTYLPLENRPERLVGEDAMLWLRIFTVALFTIYAAATVAFGFKFSNLTHRGVVSRGPYRFLRHPAYVCKCSAWWLEHIPTMTPTKAVFLSGLCGVYALRAWTEERHLSQDPEYRAYKKKVPWVLVPYVY